MKMFFRPLRSLALAKRFRARTGRDVHVIIDRARWFVLVLEIILIDR